MDGTSWVDARLGLFDIRGYVVVPPGSGIVVPIGDVMDALIEPGSELSEHLREMGQTAGAPSGTLATTVPRSALKKMPLDCKICDREVETLVDDTCQDCYSGELPFFGRPLMSDTSDTPLRGE